MIKSFRFIAFFVASIICVSAFAQVRMIAHVSKEAGGFTPGVIVANTDQTTDHEYTLTPYLQDGTPLQAVTTTITKGVTEYYSVMALFGTNDVSHFTISGDDNVEVTITYQSVQAQSSPVHVLESSAQSTAWRIYPGNWDLVWDGLAFVNTGTVSTDITIQQRDATGTILAAITDFTGIQPNQKSLYVLATDFTAQPGSYFEVFAGQNLALVSLRGTHSWATNQFLWENAAVEVEIDQHAAIANYKGVATCVGCHVGKDAEMMGSTHYRFTAALPENYIYDEEGNPVDQAYSGKFWKLCGFPTALPSANWLGKLKDDPATPFIDKPGGCARCHVGIGMVPNEMRGMTEPAAAESENIDCLICHAQDYNRKFYVATMDGEPELNSSGAPKVYAVPRIDGAFDYSGLTEAAKTVGKTTSSTCQRCHAKSGGGGMEIDGAIHSFKRGDAYAANTDVHAAAGMSCSQCHYEDQHRVKRSINADLTAYDSMLEGSMCTDCHSASPHSNTMYNSHTQSISCTTCHATSKGGVTYKDFSQVVCPSGDCGPESLNTYGVALTKFPEDFAITYAWFNGTVQKPIHPRGDADSGKIYPFKSGTFNQPHDADGNAIPLKWGKVFVGGNMDAALSVGRSMYADYIAGFAGDPSDYGLPQVPGEFDHFSEIEDMFSLSHGITKTNALGCLDCHSQQNSVLNWESLGIVNPNPM